MAVSSYIKESIEKSSWIRKMFEEGAKLKEIHGAENVFDFSIGNPDVSPPEIFFSSLEKIVKENPKGIHGYMPNAGFPFAKETITKMVKRDHDIEITGDNIVITCGAAGGLNTILKTILNPEDEIIVPRPFFVEYGFYIANHGGKMILVDTNEDFSLNIDNISNAITEKTKAVLITSPNNPTGKVYSENEIKDLADLLTTADSSIYIIADEPYRQIVYDDIKVPSIMKYYSQTIITTSFSKSLSIPGERIGYIAANPSCDGIKILMTGLTLSNRILGFVNAPALMQRVIAKMENVSVDVEAYKRRRDLFIEGLTEAGYEFIKPEGAFYIFCKSPSEDDVEFVTHLQSYNILVVPGVGFGGKGYFRISYCISEDIIKKSLPKFKEAMASFRK